MPLVVVTRNPEIVTDEMLKPLAYKLQEIVVKNLEVLEKGGDLNVDQIEVRFREPGPHDINYSDLMIEVMANWFAERAENVQERSDWIGEDVKKAKLLPDNVFGTDNFVWIFLGEAGFSLL